MNCFFCGKKYTAKHLCNELLSYDMLRGLFLSVLYSEMPKNGGDLYLGVMRRIRDNNLFELSTDISAVVNQYLEYFTNEFDVS